MIKIFIDSDIVLDLFAKREPHYNYAAKLFTLADKNKIQAFTSPIVFANVYYILSKLTSNSLSLQNLRKLKTFVKVLLIDEKVIEQSLNSEFNDFEDAMQYHTAINNGIKFIITRNKSDYKKSKIAVCTAEEFLKLHKAISV